MFGVVDNKLDEARRHLDRMGKVFIHPRHQPGFPAHYRAPFLPPGMIIAHYWLANFNSELNAFLASTRSVPDIIQNRFGYDQERKNTWLVGLDPLEKDRRKKFHREFERVFKPFLDHPLNQERNNTIHRTGVAHWEVVVQGHYGTYVGGPTNILPSAESRPITPGTDPALSFLDTPIEIEPELSDFWWVIPQAGGTPLRRPLFPTCRAFLGLAQGLITQAQTLFDTIHKGQTFTLPPF